MPQFPYLLDNNAEILSEIFSILSSHNSIWMSIALKQNQNWYVKNVYILWSNLAWLLNVQQDFCILLAEDNNGIIMTWRRMYVLMFLSTHYVGSLIQDDKTEWPVLSDN